VERAHGLSKSKRARELGVEEHLGSSEVRREADPEAARSLFYLALAQVAEIKLHDRRLPF
jgi:hypothetical protein